MHQIHQRPFGMRIHSLRKRPFSTKQIDSQYVLGTYARTDLHLVRGQGVFAWDEAGKQYLDFSSGIAVNALGHQSPVIKKALIEQYDQIGHCSNLFYSSPQAELAKRLISSSCFSKVFFCNSGTEANEAALKFARKSSGKSKPGILAFKGGFHGRTMGSLSVTFKPSIREPFEPLLPDVSFLDLNQTEPAIELIRSGTIGAVIIEPIQGEGGIRPCEYEFLNTLGSVCRETSTPLICDEVQIGCGRTGRLWAHCKYGIKPDIMTIAKPLAGGLPIGAVLVSERIASSVSYGDHGTTFGGNPLISHVGCAVFDEIRKPGFLDNVKRQGDSIFTSLKSFGEEIPGIVKEVRSGGGLLIGVEMFEKEHVNDVISWCRENGLLLISAGDKGNVIRICPPLIIEDEHSETAISLMKSAFKRLDRF